MSQPNESGTKKDLVLYKWKNKIDMIIVIKYILNKIDAYNPKYLEEG